MRIEKRRETERDTERKPASGNHNEDNYDEIISYFIVKCSDSQHACVAVGIFHALVQRQENISLTKADSAIMIFRARAHTQACGRTKHERTNRKFRIKSVFFSFFFFCMCFLFSFSFVDLWNEFLSVLQVLELNAYFCSMEKCYNADEKEEERRRKITRSKMVETAM